MKTYRLVLAGSMTALAFFGSAQADDRKDDWRGRDKGEHFAVSFLLGVATSQISDNAWTAFGLALIPGLAKEIRDAQEADNHFSWKDMAWNAVGAYVGVQTGNWLLGPQGVRYQRSF